MVATDYNRNGVWDAADYTVWRDTLGSRTDLRADGDNTGASAGVIDQDDFTFWKTRFRSAAGKRLRRQYEWRRSRTIDAGDVPPGNAGDVLSPTHNGAVNSVRRESRRSPVGANPTRPIGRSAGSNQSGARR